MLLFSFLFFFKQLILHLASGPPNKGIQKILVWGSHFWKQELYVSFIICIALPVLLKIESTFSWSLILNIYFTYGYKYGKKASSFPKIFFCGLFTQREWELCEMMQSSLQFLEDSERKIWLTEPGCLQIWIRGLMQGHLWP